jgi:hypothetical protein
VADAEAGTGGHNRAWIAICGCQEENPESMEFVAYASLVLVALVVAILVALRPYPFRQSVTPDQMNGFARIDPGARTHGVDAISTFYTWRQDQWRQLARGLAALAVTLIVALASAGLEGGKSVTETTTPPTGGETKKVTTTESDTSPEVLAFIAGFLIVGSGAWMRARALQREFSDDVARLTFVQLP